MRRHTLHVLNRGRSRLRDGRGPIPLGVVTTVRRSVTRRRGAALLEVVVALSILLVAMAVVGGAFRNGAHTIDRAERMSRARVMTERLLVEMDTGILEMEEREQSGWFGDEAMEGMSWAVEINPHERIERLLEVDVHIYLGDPDGDADERRHLLSTRVLRVEPKGLDLEEDFGLDEEQIDQLTEAIPGGAAIFDPTDFDPRMLAHLDLESLAELLPTLVQAFGVSIGGGQFDGLMQALESGDMDALQGAAEEAAGSIGAPIGGQGGLPDAGAGQGSGGRRGGGRRGGGEGGAQGGGTRQGIGERSRGGGRP